MSGSLLLWGILGYVALQLVIGAVAARRVHSSEDYILAGRKLGYGMGTFTIFATWFGAETCIGSAGEAYERGFVAGEVDPFGYALCLLVLGLFFAARFWRAQFLTLADLFRRRYSVAVERWAIALLVPTSLLWSAAQLRAFGQILATTAEIPIALAITLAIGVVLVYTVMGGMWADAITDLIQGIAITIGLVILAVTVWLAHEGGQLIGQVAPERVSLFPASDARPWYSVVNAWAIPVLNAVVCQELIARTLASRSAAVARTNCFLAAALYLVVGMIPFLLGVLGPQLVGELADPEQCLPIVARRYLSDGLYILLAGAIVSALLSTIDSALLVTATLMSHNLLPLATDRFSDRARLRWTRTWVVILGLVAYALAFFAMSVFDLVQEASSLGASALFVVITFGLWTRFGGAWAALITVMGGLGFYIWAEHIARWEAGFLSSLVLSLVLYLAVGLAEWLLGAPVKSLPLEPPP